MPTGQQLVDWCVTQRGIGYSWEGRFGPYAYDCSGLMVATMRANGIEPGGFNSTGQEIWCRDNGLAIDINTALSIPGALVFVWGYGANGHVAMSMGDGRIVETPSAEGHQVGISNFWRHNWTGAALIPGVDYGLGAVTPAEPVLQIGSQGPVVADWQRFLGIPDDGDFGPQTQGKVMDFQSLFGLEVDGIIGPQTWAARRFAETMPPQTSDPAPAPPPAPAPTSDVLDYSWARPDPAAMAGVSSGVIRYLSYDKTGKDISSEEYARLRAAGLAVGLVWETSATRTKDGWLAGLADAQEANRRANELNYPADCVIYYACDTNAKGDQATIDYMAGATYAGGRPVGFYGGDDPGNQCLFLGYARYFWQAGASSWSNEYPSPNACLVQRVGDPYGWGVDVNTVQKPWGGDGTSGAAPNPPATGMPTLSQGSKGDPVVGLQNWLNVHSNAGLDVDGDFGPATKAAVVALQQFWRDHGWQGDVDGVVGPQTWALMAWINTLSEPAPAPAPDPAPVPDPGPTGPTGPSGPPTEYRFSDNDIAVIMAVLLEHKPRLTKKKQEAIKEDLLAAVLPPI